MYVIVRRPVRNLTQPRGLARIPFSNASTIFQLDRITVNPKIFGRKPIIRGRRLAVKHVLEMLAVGDTPEAILEGYPWLERDDIRACLEYAHRFVGHGRIEPFSIEFGA